jgi:hypothetical protein
MLPVLPPRVSPLFVLEFSSAVPFGFLCSCLVCSCPIQAGHWEMDCPGPAPAPAPRPAIPPPGYVCSYCDIVGHWPENCPINPANLAKIAAAQSAALSRFAPQPSYPAARTGYSGGYGGGYGGGQGSGRDYGRGRSERPPVQQFEDRPPPPSYICRRCNLPGHWIKASALFRAGTCVACVSK